MQKIRYCGLIFMIFGKKCDLGTKIHIQCFEILCVVYNKHSFITIYGVLSMKKLSLIMLGSILLSACAGKNSLEQKLAFELGEDPSQVQVSNIKTGMYETTFNATIRGKLHNCTAMGGNALTFGQALNPQCVPVGGNKTGKKSGYCNAMLKAAGKCK